MTKAEFPSFYNSLSIFIKDDHCIILKKKKINYTGDKAQTTEIHVYMLSEFQKSDHM